LDVDTSPVRLRLGFGAVRWSRPLLCLRASGGKTRGCAGAGTTGPAFFCASTSGPAGCQVAQSSHNAMREMEFSRRSAVSRGLPYWLTVSRRYNSLIVGGSAVPVRGKAACPRGGKTRCQSRTGITGPPLFSQRPDRGLAAAEETRHSDFQTSRAISRAYDGISCSYRTEEPSMESFRRASPSPVRACFRSSR
jgi:hypothetical protein